MLVMVVMLAKPVHFGAKQICRALRANADQAASRMICSSLKSSVPTPLPNLPFCTPLLPVAYCTAFCSTVKSAGYRLNSALIAALTQFNADALKTVLVITAIAESGSAVPKCRRLLAVRGWRCRKEFNIVLFKLKCSGLRQLPPLLRRCAYVAQTPNSK